MTRVSEPLAARGGSLAINPLVDGPIEMLGNLEICSGTGRTVFRAQNVRLCRCGGSANKPFCDGTHARIGFRSHKSKDTRPAHRPGQGEKTA